MNKEDRKAILELQKTLAQIKEFGRAPINLTQYKKMGLIKIRHKNVRMPSGRIEKMFDKLILTDKANRILNIIV
jgi:hypothetical protein